MAATPPQNKNLSLLQKKSKKNEIIFKKLLMRLDITGTCFLLG